MSGRRQSPDLVPRLSVSLWVIRSESDDMTERALGMISINTGA